MGLLGLVGGVGKTLLGGGKKKQDGPRMARRMFRREGGRDIGEQEAPQQQAQPTTPLVPETFSSSPEKIQKALVSRGGTETLEGTAWRIKTSVVEIDTLLKGSLMLDKMREKRRIKNQQARRKKEENELEKGKKKGMPSIGVFLPGKAKSLWSRITTYFVTLFWGFIILRLLDNVDLFARLAKFAFSAANFIIEWGGKFLNGIVSFIDGAYGIVDGVKNTIGNLFGQAGVESFEKLSRTFVMLLNAALIAAMVSARVNMGLNRAAGARARNPEFWGPNRRRTASPKTVSRYSRRYGKAAATRRFGKNVVTKATSTVGGKAPLLALKGPFRKFAAPIVKRIPLVGALIDFGLNVFLFGESPGRAAFKAIGAGLGAALLGALASIVPFLGTWLGLVGGGIAGDFIGGWLYDRIFGQRKSGAGDSLDDSAIREADPSGGESFDALSGALIAGGSFYGLSKLPGVREKVSNQIALRTSRKIQNETKEQIIEEGIEQVAKRGGSRGVMRFLKSNWLTGVLFGGMDFADRKIRGQSNVQAGVGASADVAGGFAGAWAGGKAGAALGASIGAMVGGVGAVPGGAIGAVIGSIIGGVGGSMGAGALADAATGANRTATGANGSGTTVNKYEGGSGVYMGKFGEGLNEYHKGGMVVGSGERWAKLLGGEIVIDVDSAGPAKDMLLAINEAKGAQGVIDAIAEYAPYEMMGEKTIIVEVPTSSSTQSAPEESLGAASKSLLAGSVRPIQIVGTNEFDILHKGV